MINMVIEVTEHDSVTFKRSFLDQKRSIARFTKFSHFFSPSYYSKQECGQVHYFQKLKSHFVKFYNTIYM
jgi:hypothetical protein